MSGDHRSLKKAYEGIYEQATAPGKDRKKLLDRVLHWVMCAARPLTTNELLFAISQDFKSGGLAPRRRDLDEEWLSNLCHNFLSLDSSRDDEELFDDPSKRDSVWRLAHQAVADFLEKSDLCKAGRANYQAGAICLMVMLDTFGESPSDDKFNSHDEFRSLEGLRCPCGSSFCSKTYHHELMKPLAEYATHAWPIHLRAVKSRKAHGSDHLSQTLQKFLGKAGRTSLAFEKWREHTDGINWYYDAQWSFFLKRRPPSASLVNMSHISLASYLGLSFLLKQCFSSPSVDLETAYRTVFWKPWREDNLSFRTDKQPLWWSPAALACAHNETKILEHLFDQGAETNTTKEDEVPPIVAATMGDSKEAAEVVLRRGTEIRSLFTGRRGHILFLAIYSKSLKVLRVLLDHMRNSSDPLETERGLSEVSIRDFKSEETIIVMLQAKVRMETPLKDGTMLTAAIHNGWGGLVRQLLEQGADVNMRFENLRTGRSAVYDDAVEALLRSGSGTMKGQIDSLVHLLIDEHQAHVRGRHVGAACEFKRHKVVQKLLECDPNLDLNEIYTLNGRVTSALIQAVSSGSATNTRLVIAHKADVNLQVGGYYGDAIGAAFLTTLTRSWTDHGTSYYPTGPIVEALIQGGARVEMLTGHRLNIALAAAAHAGLKATAEQCLRLGANPNAFYNHSYSTALGAVAASDKPCALNMIRMLLDNGAHVNAYFPLTPGGGSLYGGLALDFPLQAMLQGILIGETDTDCYQRLNSKLRLAEFLVSRGAIWDIDFAQWRKCLEREASDFSRNNTESFDRLLQKMKDNISSYLQSVPEEPFNEPWRINMKDTRLDECWRRPVLGRMQAILRES